MNTPRTTASRRPLRARLGLGALLFAGACASSPPGAAGHPADPRTEATPAGPALSSLGSGASPAPAPSADAMDMANMPGMHHHPMPNSADGGTTR